MLPARFQWLCRRGMRELDLLLGRYLGEAYEAAEPGEKLAFERLLELQDDTLWRYLSGDSLPEDAALAELIRKIRELPASRP